MDDPAANSSANATTPPSAEPLRHLFLDLNSYFASVEQHLNPDLRGKPIAVVPVLADGGCIVAASYEAKKFGVYTGKRVYEAKRLCPGIIFVKTQHRAYVEIHHKVIAAVESCLPVEQVLSIDEMSCRLARAEQDPAAAVELALRIKSTIAQRIGESLRCSIGVAPNRCLAKLATDMQKPDGLVVIQSHELPHKLLHLKITELPGIGARTAEHLKKSGIASMADLYDRTEPQMERAFGGIMGRYWYRWIRGHETDDRPTHRRSIGHQHVLGPDSRSRDAAWAIIVRLLHKAAARMRHLGYFSQRISLSVGFAGQKRGPWGSKEETDPRNAPYHAAAKLRGGKQDTMTLLAELKPLWAGCPNRTPNFVGVTLSELLPASSVTAPLFAGDRRREELSRLIDELDASHGPLTVYTGAMHEARNKASGGIAFRSVPDLNLPDSVR